MNEPTREQIEVLASIAKIIYPDFDNFSRGIDSVTILNHDYIPLAPSFDNYLVLAHHLQYHLEQQHLENYYALHSIMVAMTKTGVQ